MEGNSTELSVKRMEDDHYMLKKGTLFRSQEPGRY